MTPVMPRSGTGTDGSITTSGCVTKYTIGMIALRLL